MSVVFWSVFEIFIQKHDFNSENSLTEELRKLEKAGVSISYIKKNCRVSSIMFSKDMDKVKRTIKMLGDSNDSKTREFILWILSKTGENYIKRNKKKFKLNDYDEIIDIIEKGKGK